MFNNADVEKQIALDGEIISVGGDGQLSGNIWTLPAKGMGYVVIKS